VSPLNATRHDRRTGTAGYYPSIFSYIPSPLPPGSNIYIYYDSNINFYNASYSSSSAKAYAEYQQTCAFSPNSICHFANPVNASQTASAPYNNPYGYSGSFLDYPSFHTQYNNTANTECSPEPKSLLSVASYNCNIYGDYGLPKTGTTASGSIEYCLPQFLNGTGSLTSQLGYVGTATTNSTGGFNYKFNVCGTGTARVITSYYGRPTPQPITYYQTPIGLSAQYYHCSLFNLLAGLPYCAPNTDYQPYSEFTYTDAPNETSTSFPIGSYALGFGSIELPIAFASIILILALLYRRSNG